MEHNRCTGNAARRSARWNRRLFSLHKSLAAMVQMIVQAGGHSEAITYSPVGALAPVIVLRPAGGHPVMPRRAQQLRINEPAVCTGSDVCVCVSNRHLACGVIGLVVCLSSCSHIFMADSQLCTGLTIKMQFRSRQEGSLDFNIQRACFNGADREAWRGRYYASDWYQEREEINDVRLDAKIGGINPHLWRL